MLLSSVILILREVLEAAMLISVLLALSVNMRCGARWFWLSLPLAAIGTVLFATSLDVITDALDGAGQEIANAALQGMVYCFIVAIVWLSADGVTDPPRANVLRALMGSAVTCAMIREGSEILVYITGFAAVEETRTAIFAGSALGAGIGLSLGVLLFSTLRAIETGLANRGCLILLSLIGAGMVMQSTMLLEQVDWFPAGSALWDSSGLISEQSIAGELLYAVFGYESTPGVLQVVLYTASLVLAFAAYAAASFSRRPVYDN